MANTIDRKTGVISLKLRSPRDSPAPCTLRTRAMSASLALLLQKLPRAFNHPNMSSLLTPALLSQNSRLFPLWQFQVHPPPLQIVRQLFTFQLSLCCSPAQKTRKKGVCALRRQKKAFFTPRSRKDRGNGVALDFSFAPSKSNRGDSDEILSSVPSTLEAKL